MGYSSLVKIDKTLVEPASITCARAFEDDTLTHWMIPNPKKRVNLRYAFEMHLRMSAAGDSSIAYATSPNCEGVAIWVKAGAKDSLMASLAAGFPFLPLRCGWRYFWRDSRSTSMCNKLRSKFAPILHCYLAVLAVTPEHQGKGMASALVKPMLEILDQDKMSCYVETQNMKNVGMYQHFGFKLVHQTCLPSKGPPLYLMLRQME
ncbi:MAG: GNAT family N-acetyltransferase [Dehalococcoidia bacterium]|jgi:ribosomal protein S18 acetylase RimI-like enzyme|nr:GNAT family N-acetyltransferase [Dehalococcoidia bacterium]